MATEGQWAEVERGPHKPEPRVSRGHSRMTIDGRAVQRTDGVPEATSATSTLPTVLCGLGLSSSTVNFRRQYVIWRCTTFQQ